MFLAGLLTWGVLQAVFPVFKLPEELANLPTPSPPEKAAEQALAQAVADRYNAILTLAVLGAAAAGFLSAAEAVARHRPLSAFWRGPLGSTVGGVIGAAAGLIGDGVLAACQSTPALTPLGNTIAVQCTELGVLGLGIGAGVGVAVGSFRLSLHLALGGVLGGVLTGIAYPAIVGYLLPNVQTEHVVPIESNSQLIWLVAASLLMALIMAGLGGRNDRRANEREG
jgi:hypothetical protein